MTTVSDSFSTTSWPGLSASMSTAGLTLTRILRPPVNTSAAPSSQRLRKMPKPDGGLVSRSTSSFSATIWSRASRSVSASRSFCRLTVDNRASASPSRSSSNRDCRGESVSLRRRTATSSSRKEICVVRLLTWSSCRPANEPSSRVATPPPPFPEQVSPRPYLPRAKPQPVPWRPPAAPRCGRRRLPGCLRVAGAFGGPAPPRRCGDSLGQPPGGDEEAGVTYHPVLGPDRETVGMPSASEGFPCGRLVETPLAANGLHRRRELGHGGDVTGQDAAGQQRPCRG